MQETCLYLVCQVIVSQLGAPAPPTTALFLFHATIGNNFCNWATDFSECFPFFRFQILVTSTSECSVLPCHCHNGSISQQAEANKDVETNSACMRRLLPGPIHSARGLVEVQGLPGELQLKILPQHILCHLRRCFRLSLHFFGACCWYLHIHTVSCMLESHWLLNVKCLQL